VGGVKLDRRYRVLTGMFKKSRRERNNPRWGIELKDLEKR
jgi:hypothetical protein